VIAVSVSRLLVLALCLALPAASFAQRQKSIVPDLETEGHKGDMARAAQKKANERYDKADENNDGSITKEEALKHLPYVGENFEKFDKNKDGKLTWEEYIGHDKWKRESTK
jgi:Ca2+-binding EF-hand superfamily protein